MGMGFAPTWLRQVSPPASQNHFNHCRYVLYREEVGRFALKGEAQMQENAQNWGALELRRLGMGGVAGPKIHAPLRHVLPFQIW